MQGACPSVECRTLPGDCTSLDEARRTIEQLLINQSRPTLLIVLPSYAKFPDFDGFICYRSMGGSIRIIGYQIKLSRAYPKRDVPTWLECGLLIRGTASSVSSTSSSEKTGWKYLSRNEIHSFLGYSLSPLYPDSWPEVVNIDSFD